MDELANTIGDLCRDGTMTILMWVAIGLGLVVVGVLTLENVRRKSGQARYRTLRRGLRRTLTLPFRRAWGLYQALRELRRRRARRALRAEPRHRHRRHETRELKERTELGQG
jgi:hypothetical protein